MKPSSHARNIGAIFDTTMSMLPHVNSFGKSAFYHLRTISRIRKYLSTQTTEILIHAFVTSKLNHCNSLLYNVPKNVIKKLQSVQNAAARLITRSRKCDTQFLITSLPSSSIFTGYPFITYLQGSASAISNLHSRPSNPLITIYTQSKSC